jgi:short chain dehydrogenase
MLKACPSPLQGAVDRVDCRAQHVAHLVGRVPEHVAQDEHGQLARGQCLECGHESQGDSFGLFVACLRAERCVECTVEEGVGVWLEQHLAVNLFGTYGVTQAFLPLLARSRGAIVNNVSMMAFAPLPFTPAYAISKAAAFNFTQSLRALLAGRGVRVHAVLTGPTDTDMTRGFDIPKASPESVARAIFDGVEQGEEDIFPDPLSASLSESWRNGPAKAFEHEYAALVGAEPVAS